MNRRRFVRLGTSTLGLALISIAGLALAKGDGRLPFAAQPRVARLGLAWSGYQGSSADQINGFRAGLRDAGWVEGQNLVIDERHYEDHPDHMPDLAAELLALKPDVLVGGIAPAVAFKRATDSIPIVFGAVGDPFGAGLVESYARPGRNITGTSRTAGTTLTRKNLEYLRQLLPQLARVAVTYYRSDPVSVGDLRDIQSAAEAIGIDAQPVGIASFDDLEPALDAALAGHPQAMLATYPGGVPQHIPTIIRFATGHGLPTAALDVGVGGLLNYGPNLPALFRRAGSYHVDRILRGAKPADLPVEGPTVFDLVVNQTTARTLGLEIPIELAAQVTEWIP